MKRIIKWLLQIFGLEIRLMVLRNKSKIFLSNLNEIVEKLIRASRKECIGNLKITLLRLHLEKTDRVIEIGGVN